MEFTAQSAAKGLELLPARPLRIIACGGGRKNPTLMAALSAACGLTVETAEDLGWNGDLIEAQAFGFLAIRSLKGLPLSYPGTTGVGAPTPGGVLNEP